MHTPSETIAVLSDIHGNTWALDAVLGHARDHGATRVITLGDIAYGPLDPGGVVERLRSLDLPAIHIAGNQDRIIWEASKESQRWASLDFTRSSLSEAQMDWLQSLPPEIVSDGMRLCHGSPSNDDEYLLAAVNETGLHLRLLTDVIHKLEGVEQSVVLCGHSHLPACVRTPAGLLVVNPGSVGLQAFSEDTPWPHLVENRSPHARYALMQRGPQGWDVAQVAVTYDWEAAARVAESNHRPDWARVLRSGWV